MHLHATYPEAPPLSWRDIEALPYYAAALLALAGLVQLLGHVGTETQAMTIKAALIAAILALRHAFTGREMARDSRSPTA